MAASSRESIWQPDQSKIQAVRQSIESMFKQGRKSDFLHPRPQSGAGDDGRDPAVRPDDDFILACAKIGAFLQDQNAVIRQLKKLNTRLSKLLAETNNQLIMKSLRQLMENELSKFGFHPKFGKTLGFVEPAGFRAAIANGLILKDPGANERHGEFTHALQWLLIACQEEETPFIGYPVIEIFKRLGHEESVYDREALNPAEPSQPRSESGIWDLIVDNVAISSNLFCSPENLHEYILLAKEEELKLLAFLFVKRVEKRAAASGEDMVNNGLRKLKQSLFYHQSTIPKVLEPQDSQIEYEQFKQSSH